MKIDTQYIRALIGTVIIFSLFYLGATLFVSQSGFLKLVGFVTYSVIVVIQLFINYRFIKWSDEELEQDEEEEG